MCMIKVIGMDESGDFETVRMERKERTEGGKTNYIINQDSMQEDIRFIGGYTFPVEKKQFEVVKQELNQMFRFVCTLVAQQCHKKKIDDAELLALCDCLRIHPGKVNRNYHVVFPISLHGSTIPGNSKVFFKLFRRGYYNPLKLSDESQSERENLLAWERLFGAYLEEQVISYIKEHNGKLFCYLYPNAILDVQENQSLYETMAAHVVKNEFFNGTDEIYSGYAWEIATRVIPIEESNEENRNIHIERYEKQAGAGRYLITNLTTYRTLLQEILAGVKDSDLGGLVQDIHDSDFKEDIKSIKYFNTERVDREVDGKKETSSCMKGVAEQELTPFHYAADVACGAIWAALQNHKWLAYMRNGKNSGVLERVSDGITKKYGLDVEIRIYGEQDETLIRMIHAVHNAEIHTYFDMCYDMKGAGDGFSRFYVNKWLPKLDGILKRKLENTEYAYRDVDGAVCLINKYMTADHQYARGMYITEQFFEKVFGWQLKKANESFKINEKPVGIPKEKYFSFILNLLRGYNHRGAAREPQKIIDWVNRSGILKELYPQGELNYYNVCLQYYFNSLQYEKVLNEAFNLGLKASDSVHGLSKLVNRENPLVRDNQMEQAKIFSSAGQACGFLLAENGYDHVLERIGIEKSLLEQTGLENYQHALQIFDELEQTDNYGITMSHYLQYLCLIGDKEEYEKNAKRYFEADNMEGQLEKAVTTSKLYYLRVFLKAFETFYLEEENIAQYLKKIMEYVDRQEKKTPPNTNHPMELIEAAVYRLKTRMNHGVMDLSDVMYRKAVTSAKNEDDVILLIRFHTKLKAVLQYHAEWMDDLLIEHIDRYSGDEESYQNITVTDLYVINLFDKVLDKTAAEMTFKELDNFLDAMLGYEYY